MPRSSATDSRSAARPTLPERSVVRRHGIPVTTPIQTLIDLATELKPMRLERAVNQADVHDLVDPETLRRSLDGYRRDARGEDAADDARPAHVPALRFGPRDLLPAARPRRRVPVAADQRLGPRLRGRLPLPRPRPDRRDRRPALPPHPGPAGPHGQTRPDAHLTRLPRPPLHPLADRPRAERSRRRPGACPEARSRRRGTAVRRGRGCLPRPRRSPGPPAARRPRDWRRRRR